MLKTIQKTEYLTLSQAAKELFVSEQTVRNMVDRNELDAYVTEGGHRRFLIEDVRYTKLKLANPDQRRTGIWYATCFIQSDGKENLIVNRKCVSVDPTETSFKENIEVRWMIVNDSIKKDFVKYRAGEMDSEFLGFNEALHAELKFMNGEEDTTACETVKNASKYHDENHSLIMLLHIVAVGATQEEALKQLLNKSKHVVAELDSKLKPVTGVFAFEFEGEVHHSNESDS